MTDVDRARALLLEHLPNLTPHQLEFHSKYLSSGAPLMNADAEAFRHAPALEALEKMRRAVVDLTNGYKALPDDLRARDPFWDVLVLAQQALGGKEFERRWGYFKQRGKPAPEVGKIERYRQSITSANEPHHNQVKHGGNEKAALVSYARELWQKNTGKPAPSRPSEGANYYKFVASLIEFVGQDWGVERTLAAWVSRQIDG